MIFFSGKWTEGFFFFFFFCEAHSTLGMFFICTFLYTDTYADHIFLFLMNINLVNTWFKICCCFLRYPLWKDFDIQMFCSLWELLLHLNISASLQSSFHGLFSTSLFEFYNADISDIFLMFTCIRKLILITNFPRNVV